jgi:hypothetical protein
MMAGHAVAGGEAPGYVVVGGTLPVAEPMPVGVIQGSYAYQGPGAGGAAAAAMAAAGMPAPGPQGAVDPRSRRTRGGSGDSAVLPSSYSNDPYLPNDHNRPHIVRHMFGLDAIGARGRADRERRARENHAMIRYQPETEAVSELPSKMVYGR